MNLDLELHLEELERGYKSSLPYYREYEKQIIESFSQKDFMEYIEDTKWRLDFEKHVYNQKLKKRLKSLWMISEITEFFIVEFYRLFHWWAELKMAENYIERYSYLHRRKHHSENSQYQKKSLDIHDVEIERVISMYTDIKGSMNRNILCPLHKEKSPSFRIFKNTNSFYCYGCNAWGNALNFISLAENITTKEAFKKFQNYFNA